jgi:hypothetical protein
MPYSSSLSPGSTSRSTLIKMDKSSLRLKVPTFFQQYIINFHSLSLFHTYDQSQYTADTRWRLSFERFCAVLSRVLVSQSASVTCSTLAGVVVLFVIHVNIAFKWSSLLLFSIRYTTGVLNMKGERCRFQFLHRHAGGLVYKVLSYLNRTADAGVPIHDAAKAQDVVCVCVCVGINVTEVLLWHRSLF